jgi:hypothetical protein
VYQSKYLSRKEAGSLAQSILTEEKDLAKISKLLPRPRLRQTRWWYRGKRSVKRAKVTKEEWLQIVLEERTLLPLRINKSDRMHKFYGMYQGIEAFLLSPLVACKARHVQLLPSFALEPYYIPLTMNCLSEVLKREGIVVQQDAILRECFDFKKLNRATGLRMNAPAAGGGSGGGGGERAPSFFHHKKVMRPEFITTNGYTFRIHTASVMTKQLLLDDVKSTVREQGRAVERNEILNTIAKRLRHLGRFDKDDSKTISMLLNWLLNDGSLVVEEREKKTFWSLPGDAAMEVDAEMPAAPAPAPAPAPAATAEASGIPSAEPGSL